MDKNLIKKLKKNTFFVCKILTIDSHHVEIKYWKYNKQWLLASEFSEFEYSRETRCFFKCARLARLADIRQAVLRRLARLADIRQAVLHGLARLAKGEFGKFYANLVSLASLANLASVG